MTDVELLHRLLARPDLGERERSAFRDMAKRLQWFSALTPRSRNWARDVAARLGIDVGAKATPGQQSDRAPEIAARIAAHRRRDAAVMAIVDDPADRICLR